MEGHYHIHNNDSDNATLVTMVAENQMVPPVALYSTEIPLTSAMLHVDTYTNNFENNNTLPMNHMYTSGVYEPQITATPVVKSHNSLSMYTPPIGNQNINHSQQQQQQQQLLLQQQTIFSPLEGNRMANINGMEIDEYFTAPSMENPVFTNTMQNVYSPSSTSVTTNNSSIMFMDNSISPSSPTNMISPINQQNMSNSDYPMDSFMASNYQQNMLTDSNMMDHQMYSETPIVPTDIGMYAHYHPHNMLPYNDDSLSSHYMQQSPYVERRRPLPRRHTVSTPYDNNTILKDTAESSNTISVPQAPTTKSRKSSLKSKRHRSLGKLEMYSTSSTPPLPDNEILSEKLESWSHQQLLQRIQELEKEKQVTQNSLNKQVTPDEGGVGNKTPPTTSAKKPSATTNKARSAPHTDTELEDEDDDDEIHVCQWDTCVLEFNTLNDLIFHVKADHIGSGKANYYCCWKDCARKQKPFTKRHKMHNHLRTHTGERPFVCEEPDCGKRFSRLDSLTTHAKIHSNIRPYLCSYSDCGKAYYHLRSLRKHERSHTQQTMDNSTPPPLPASSFIYSGGGENEVFTDWGLSVQAAVLNVMDRDNPYV